MAVLCHNKKRKWKVQGYEYFCEGSLTAPYLPVWIHQQQMSHSGSLHPTKDVLTRGRAAFSDQEIPAAGEERLCLFSVQPGNEIAKAAVKYGFLKKTNWNLKITDTMIPHLPWNQPSWWIRLWTGVSIREMPRLSL